MSITQIDDSKQHRFPRMKNTILAGVAILASSIASHAVLTPGPVPGTLVDSANIASTSVGAALQYVTLQKFDPALVGGAPLTKVEFRLETTTSGSSLAFDNESFVSGPVTLALATRVIAQTGVNLTSFALSNTTTTATNPNISVDSDLPNIPNGDPTGAPNFIGVDSVALNPITQVNGVGTFTRTTNDFLAQFTKSVSSSSYPVAITSLFTNPGTLTSSPAGLSGVFNTPSQLFTGRVTVTYTFASLAAVPEASTLLFGAALGLGLAFRRFRPQIS